MSRNSQFEVDEDEDEEYVDETTLLRQLRKQLKDAQKRDAEREAELARLRGADRERSLSEVLAAKGLNSKVAKLYPKDAEATPEAVDTWLSEYGDVFGAKPEDAEPDFDEASIAAHQRIAGASQNAAGPTRTTDAAARIASASSAEELIAFLQSGQ